MIITLMFPAGKYVVSLKSGFLNDISKIKSGLGLAFVLFCVFPARLGSETLIVTTYYPPPFGAYASLLTTGRTLLARDIGNVGIGTTDLTLLPPNAVDGNLYVNDIYLRGRTWPDGTTGTWASRLPITSIYTATNRPRGLSCMLNAETITGAGCRSGWEFILHWTLNIPRWEICLPIVGCVGVGPFTLEIGPFTLGFVLGCATEPAGDGKTMWFLYPSLIPATAWISCIRNE